MLALAVITGGSYSHFVLAQIFARFKALPKDADGHVLSAYTPLGDSHYALVVGFTTLQEHSQKSLERIQ